LKKLLAIIPVIIILSLLFVTPVFAWGDIEVSAITAAEDWISNNPGANNSTEVTISVENTGTHQGVGVPIAYGVTSGSFVQSGITPGIQNVNAGETKDWSFIIGTTPGTTEGYYDVAALFLAAEKYGWFWLPSLPAGCENDVFGVDNTYPNLGITSGGAGLGNAYYTFTPFDALSGVNSAVVTIDGLQVIGQTLIYGCGNHTVNYQVLDNAGNLVEGTAIVTVPNVDWGIKLGQPMYDCYPPYKQLVYGVDYGWDTSVPGGKFWVKR